PLPLRRALLSVPPPLRPPLFPYTTLFRSVVELLERFRLSHRVVIRAPVDGRVRPASLPGIRMSVASAVELCALLRGDEHSSTAEDRKSTRLNSSHVSISYAVFCLKKKKTL